MPIEIQIPGSKSITNRALVMAALSEGTTILKNAAVCDDSRYMINALKKLGVKIHQKGENIKISGIYKNNKLNFPKQKKQISIYTGNAGTTTRFITALASLTGNKVTIDGDERMRLRPIKDLTDALNKLGAKITTTNSHLPICIHEQSLEGGKISLPGNISSQYLTAILLTAQAASQKATINIEQKLCSRPYIEMTLKVLKSFKINIKNKNFRQFVVEPMKHTKPTHSTKTYKVESDASSASYMGAYAALHPNKTTLLKNIHKNSIQGDIKFLKYLKEMGCEITEQKNGTLIKGTRELKSLGIIDMNETPDIVMTFAVLTLFTRGKTKITNIENLRIKETNRITALKNELKKLGAKVKTGKDWIEIENLSRQQKINLMGSKKKITIETYNDHRMTMSFAILTDIFPQITIINPSCVSKSYTTFWQDLKKISKAT